MTPQGIDLIYIQMDRAYDLFTRMLMNREFDIAEMSFGTCATRVGQPDFPFVVLPVFTSRMFRHSGIYIHKNSGIQSPLDLAGKRVGITEWQNTAAIWMRGILHEEYDVDLTQIEWCQGGLDWPALPEELPFKLPTSFAVHPIPKGKTLFSMIESGEVDALLSPRVPPVLWEEQDKVQRLFPDYRKVEVEYFQRTGIFPIMHTIVIQHDLYERHPWVARSLYDAFEDARKSGYNHTFEKTGAPRFMLPWLLAEYEATRQLMGDNAWAYGIESNQKTLDTFLRYVSEQGLTETRREASALFANETLDT